MTFSRDDQHRIWEAEHATPTVLHQMDSDRASSGVVPFYEQYVRALGDALVGVEMGCGKGRNVIWLAQQDGVREMHGLDFSHAALAEAATRADHAGATRALFHEQDVTLRWPFDTGSVDFVIDCFSTTDIEDPVGRRAAVDESFRVLRSGGLLLVYTLSIDDEFHKEMILKSPAAEPNAFHHPETGKFEKTFDAEELASLHSDFELIESRRIEKTSPFHGKEYQCKHFWNIYRKP